MAVQEEQQILDYFRRWGFFQADIFPLRPPSPPHPDLQGKGAEAELGRRYYCGTIGAEFMHIPDPERRAWIQERMEQDPPKVDGERILRRLLQADHFEQVLQSRYIGTKRFSVEGASSLLPLLDEMLRCLIERQAEQALLAMSHRGRLNVIVNIVGRPASQIFGGFEDVDPKGVLGGGDVKYHLGATGDFQTENGFIRLHLVSNPSHLEAVDPVALGRTRAKQAHLGENSWKRVVPIIMHGDAAFAGQGILAETLNLTDLNGYSVGGCVHVIVNNLIGFTSGPDKLHSSCFSSDVAKRLPIPILHVNGEDPEAVIRAGRMAVDFRDTFSSDVVIDLIGYRRHGHSEVDDPTVTQPRLYAKIQKHPLLSKIYADRIGVESERFEKLSNEIREVYEAEQRVAAKLLKKPVLRELPSYWSSYHGGLYDHSFEVKTGLPAEILATIADGLCSYPHDFAIHPKVERLLQQRREMGQGKRPVDYGMAEALAFGSLVTQGVPIRMSGQDSRRGTFNQRHSVLIDIETEREFIPLKHLKPGQACFEIYDSMLSEAAVLGFEYGYSRDYPDGLVLWEAQFGDFANGAQVIIDQFIVAGEDKWDLLSGVVMLLPHGYEGQGPEHSSARIERYLQLAAEDNIQICQPSTAAQYFHMLRRQALIKWRKPLVVFTPKSMLRHADSSSKLEEFSRDAFLPVLGDKEVEKAERVIFCTGKIGHELRAERARRHDQSTAIVFVERLFPLPERELTEELDRHEHAREILWVQEEPANMGALFYMRPALERLSGDRPVRSVKRSASASPSTGSAKAHAMEQKTLLNLAFAPFHRRTRGQ
jgi:2-oxoglutarate dehydrogenase E1 component